jgi:hypothetical protein
MTGRGDTPPWWLGSAINLSAGLLTLVTTWLYHLGLVNEVAVKVPKFLRPVLDIFGETGLYVAFFVIFFLVWWVIILIVASKLFPAAFK